ncbi:PREDICTED: metastasis-suppressor KiSS-1 [Ceratotherium simum simum]|uniref:Metastasis-suppressor KiSS-1 n=2 Tax=Rhinocerotidae TaxID=9803 RepID=A0ABM0HE74_CERSS|nr:PREDICTED: metastasis-suppressor KiSS-1 [Ceratotherium simum simum]
MNSLVFWQLMLFLCATSFRETLEKVAPAENPRSTGRRLGPLALLAPWAQSPRRAEGKPALAGPRPRGAWLCPPPGSSAGPQRPGPCTPRSRRIPAPRGAAPVQREKALPAYNWNSFGLRYGRRRAAPGTPTRVRARGAGAGGRAEGG